MTALNCNYSILISSCEKFSDLWKTHFDLLFENWVGEIPPIYLLTDKQTDFSRDGVKIITVEEGDMPIRIKKALDHIETDRILFTLDDYFVINKVRGEDISFLCGYAEKNEIDYLLLYNRRFAKKRYYKGLDSFVDVDINERYAVTLYPAIWRKRFLDFCIDKELTPWKFEPTLTKKAREYNAKCVFSQAGSFEILDVVRKGKVLHKANGYFKKHGIDIGDRPLIKRSTEFKFAFMDLIRWHTPKWLFRIIKKTAKLFGMKFYSED